MDWLFTKPIVWSELFHALPALPAGNRSAAEPSSNDAPNSMLLDDDRTADLGKMAGPAKLSTFLCNPMESAEALLGEIHGLREKSPELARVTHRLAGTAPSFGLPG
jgi:hypothetical protein